MYCRRCFSRHLLRLEKKLAQDNAVFRCQECGFLFSPLVPPRPSPDRDRGGPEPGQGEARETNALGPGAGATGGAGPPFLPLREGKVQPRE